MTTAKRNVLWWVLALAMLAVGARNFEQGFTIDSPLYATIARELARGAPALELPTRIEDFPPYYAEHTHGGFWIFSLILRVLPAEDWAIRIPNHLFYVFSLFLLFLLFREWRDEKSATWAVLLLWAWPIFANYHSSVYLDPGALFFGIAALYALWRARCSGHVVPALLAGLSLACCALVKGLTVLGFGPACAWILLNPWQVPRLKFSRALWLAGAAVALMAALLLLYVYAIRNSAYPDFLHRYWERQMSGRFAKHWDWAYLVKGEFWRHLARDTHHLLWLLLPGIFVAGRSGWAPFVWLGTFVLMYAPAMRIGGQYWIYLMPGVAFFVGSVLAAWIPLGAEKLQKGSFALALLLLFIVQYGPFPTHLTGAPSEADAIAKLRAKGLLVESAYFDAENPDDQCFINSSRFTWYSDIDVNYVKKGSPPPRPSAGKVYIYAHVDTPRAKEIAAAGWCRFAPYTVWQSCH